MLKTMANIMNKSVRNVDLVGRYGGEEFVLFLPETTKDNAFILADRLRVWISEAELEGLPKVTMSLGIASYPDDGRDIEDLIDKADSALYAAKKSGRNRVVKYSSDISQNPEK